ERPVLDDQMRIVCWAHAVPGLYSPNGTMQYAGGSYQWMKNTICLSEAAEAKRRMDDVSVYDLINEEIASSEPGADGLIFLPHLMGERAPRWNANAKGVFYGITPTTTRAQLLRSVMEGIILNLKLCYDILMRDRKTMDAEPMMLVGGAARSSEWQRCVANCFGTDVHVPALLEESTSMGAAVIAGVGSGIFKDFSAAEQFIQTAAIRQPEVQYAQAYRTLQRDTECLYQALLPVYNRQDQRR
ncbi:MAG: xylulokinase, partial [Lachnospiraceae bacterium]|nr:xylulokinase [Lachnospiraceae bacterium]